MDSKLDIQSRIETVRKLISTQYEYIEYLEKHDHIPIYKRAAAYADLDDLEEELAELLDEQNQQD